MSLADELRAEELERGCCNCGHMVRGGVMGLAEELRAEELERGCCNCGHMVRAPFRDEWGEVTHTEEIDVVFGWCRGNAWVVDIDAPACEEWSGR